MKGQKYYFIRMILSTIWIIICLSVMILFAQDQDSPALINYQGFLTDNDGKALTGTYQITFLLYDKSEGGESLWSETHTVEADNGLFNVLLGGVDSTLSHDLFDGERYLAMKIGTEAELSPRMRMTSVAYSLRAEQADAAFTLDAPDDGPEDIVYVDKTGNVGIGTTSPSAALDVSGNIVSDNVMIKVHEGYPDGSKNYTIPNLDGNTHKIYKIYIHGKITTTQDVYLMLRPNGDAGSNYRCWWRNDGDASSWEGPVANWGIFIGRSAWNRTAHVSYEMTFFAGSGQDRFGVGTGAMWDEAQPTAGFIMLQSWGKWHNTTDNIISMTIAALNSNGVETSYGTFTGTVIVYASDTR